MFACMPSRVGRGRRAAVDFVVCFRWGEFFRVFFFFSTFFFFERTRPTASTRPPLASFTSLLVIVLVGSGVGVDILLVLRPVVVAAVGELAPVRTGVGFAWLDETSLRFCSRG